MQFFLNGLPIGAIYSLVALGYSLIYAASGVLNWSQGDMVMLGAYVGFTVFFFLKLGFISALFLAIVVVALLGALVQYMILRPLREREAPPINVVIATLGVAIICRNLALGIWGPDPQILPSPVEFTTPFSGGSERDASGHSCSFRGDNADADIAFFLKKYQRGEGVAGCRTGSVCSAVGGDRPGALGRGCVCCKCRDWSCGGYSHRADFLRDV